MTSRHHLEVAKRKVLVQEVINDRTAEGCAVCRTQAALVLVHPGDRPDEPGSYMRYIINQRWNEAAIADIARHTPLLCANCIHGPKHGILVERMLAASHEAIREVL